jgi:hypothetical protein
MFIFFGLSLYHVFQSIQAQPTPCNFVPFALVPEVTHSENTLLSVYPNPFSNALKIQSLHTIKVYLKKGDLFWKKADLEDVSYVLNEISEFKKGIYVSRIVSEKSQIQTLLMKL